MTIEFLLTSALIVASPGPGVLLTIATGLSRGAKASSLAAAGCTIGIIPHLAAALTGIAAVVHANALAFQAIKIAGVAYLLFIAWSTLREKGALRIPATEPGLTQQSSSRVIVSAVLLNLLNPKLSIFFVAFLPQFVALDDPTPLLSVLRLSLVFMGMTLAVFLLYGWCAAAARDLLVDRPAVMLWLRRSFAAAFVALGVRLAFASR